MVVGPRSCFLAGHHRGPFPASRAHPYSLMCAYFLHLLSQQSSSLSSLFEQEKVLPPLMTQVWAHLDNSGFFSHLKVLNLNPPHKIPLRLNILFKTWISLEGSYSLYYSTHYHFRMNYIFQSGSLSASKELWELRPMKGKFG